MFIKVKHKLSIWSKINDHDIWQKEISSFPIKMKRILAGSFKLSILFD